VLILFALVAMGAAPLLPDDGTSAGRVRMVETVCLGATGFFIFVIAIFLSSSSLAREIEARRIYNLATKPVTRGGIILGKFIGAMIVNLALVAGMGLISYGAIRAAGLRAETDDVLASREAVVAWRLTPPAPPGPEGDSRLLDVSPDKPTIWSFKGLQGVKAREREAWIVIQVYAGAVRPLADLDVTIRNPATGVSRAPQLRVTSGRAERFSFPTELISDSGELDISMAPAPSTGAVFIRPRTCIAVMRLAGTFAGNLAKELLLILTAAALLTMVSIAGASGLSFPVAALVGLFVLVSGNLAQYVLTATEEQAASRTLSPSQAAAAADEKPPAPGLGKRIMDKTGHTLARIMPNLARYDAADMLADGRCIPWSLIGEAFFWVLLVRGGICAAAAWLILEHRELAA